MSPPYLWTRIPDFANSISRHPRATSTRASSEPCPWPQSTVPTTALVCLQTTTRYRSLDFRRYQKMGRGRPLYPSRQPGVDSSRFPGHRHGCKSNYQLPACRAQLWMAFCLDGIKKGARRQDPSKRISAFLRVQQSPHSTLFSLLTSKRCWSGYFSE